MAPESRPPPVSELTGCEILVEGGFTDPGGSVKDRTALGIILDTESTDRLRPGDTIVEGTAGNTGIGLAVIGHANGYRTVIKIPDTQSQERLACCALSAPKSSPCRRSRPKQTLGIHHGLNPIHLEKGNFLLQYIA